MNGWVDNLLNTAAWPRFAMPLMVEGGDDGGSGGSGGSEGGDDGGSGGSDADWRSGLSDEDRGWLDTKGYDEPLKLIGAYRNAEQIIGSNPDAVIRLPGKEATSDQWDAVYSKLGVPAEAGEYELPELANGYKADAELDKYLAEQALGLKLRQDQFNDLRARHYSGDAELRQAHETRITEATDAYERELTTKLGAEGYKEHQALTRAAFRFLAEGSDEDKLWGRLERAGFTSDVAFMSRLAEMGRAMQEDGELGEGGGEAGGNSIPAIRQQIADLKADEDFKKRFLNRRDPQHKAAVAQLTALNEKLAEAEGRTKSLQAPSAIGA